MAKGDRKVPDIHSGSTADIAFLLLIFFLITTSMDIDRGLARRLPEPPAGDPPVVVKERNVFQIFLNANDQLMAAGEYIHVKDLKPKVKEFIENPYNDEKLPEKHEMDIPLLGGKVRVTQNHVISLQNDRGSSYEAYMEVQNELVATYNELRNKLAQENWQKNYDALEEPMQRAIRDYYPQKISEAEPKNYGGN